MLLRKKLLVFILALVMCLGATACVKPEGDGGDGGGGNGGGGNLSKKITVNISVLYQDSSRIVHTSSSLTNAKNQSVTYTGLDGNQYLLTSLKPVWVALQNRLNVTFKEKTSTDMSSVENNFKAQAINNFSGIDVINGTAYDINSYGTKNNSFVDLSQHLANMPNFKAFLDNHPIVDKSLRSNDGEIYYAPYFDGIDDIERMFMMRADWVKALLDNEDDTKYDTSAQMTFHYTRSMPEALDTDVTVVKADGSGTQTITKEYGQGGNIIDRMGSVSTKDGKNLAIELKDYIDDVYGNTFENRSDLFIGQDAAYDADELVALLRCVKANPRYLTGKPTAGLSDITPFYPRANSADRTMDVLRLASIWGVRGLDSRNDFLFVSDDGTLKDARLEMDTLDAIERLQNLYKEGLIQSDFNKTAGSVTDFRNAVNDASKNAGFMTYDYNQTTTIINDIRKDNYSPLGTNEIDITPVLMPVADWDKDGNYYQFTESWRSVKSEGWAILASVTNKDKLDRLIYMFDYMYSPEGSKLMGYGPDEWIDGNNTVEYRGALVPKLKDETLEQMKTYADGNYTDYYRKFLGATLPIGYVKEQGMEYQTTNAKGKVGLNKILRAVELGTVKYTKLAPEAGDNPTHRVVPTTLPFASTEQQLLDNQTTLSTNFNLVASIVAGKNLYVDYIVAGFGGLTKEQIIDNVGVTMLCNNRLEIFNFRYAAMWA